MGRHRALARARHPSAATRANAAQTVAERRYRSSAEALTEAYLEIRTLADIASRLDARDHLDADVVETLGEVGRMARAHRVMLVPAQDDAAGRIGMPHQWHATGLEPLGADLLQERLRAMPWVVKRLVAGQGVTIRAGGGGSADNEPDRERLREWNVAWLTVQPLVAAGALRGALLALRYAGPEPVPPRLPALRLLEVVRGLLVGLLQRQLEREAVALGAAEGTRQVSELLAMMLVDGGAAAVAGRVLDRLVEASECAAAFIHEVRESPFHLVLVASRGLAAEEAVALSSVEPAGRLAAWLETGGTPLVLPDLDHDDGGLPDALLSKAYGSLALFRAPDGRSPVAVVGCYWAEACVPTAGKLALLGALVDQAGLVLAFGRSGPPATGATARSAAVDTPPDGPAADEPHPGIPGHEADASREARLRSLTPREWEVLRLVAEHLSNPKIAVRLHRSVNTVRAHMRSILRKLGVATRAEAVRYAGLEATEETEP